MRMRKRKQSGFTIIELVVVILLLGIMAATALPRFMDVTDEAHASVINGVNGGLQAGMSLYRGQWIAEGQPVESVQIAAFGDLRVNAEGYPYGTTDQTANGHDVFVSADCAAVFTNMLQVGSPSIGSVANLAAVVNQTNDFTTHVSGDDCVYYYTAAGAITATTIPTLSYDSETGAIDQGTQLLP
ncbi:MAG: MSHA pilin protein MshB [Candidatus Azotimanducaceae bacterium]|jgi:MSHA pilin protein MshB